MAINTYKRNAGTGVLTLNTNWDPVSAAGAGPGNIPNAGYIGYFQAASLGGSYSGTVSPDGLIIENTATAVTIASGTTLNVGSSGIDFKSTNNKTWQWLAGSALNVAAPQTWVLYNSTGAASIDIRGALQGSANVSVTSAVAGTRSFTYSNSTTSNYTGTITFGPDIGVGVDGTGTQWGTANTATLKFTGTNNALYSGAAATVTAKLEFDGASVLTGNIAANLIVAGGDVSFTGAASTLTIQAGQFAIGSLSNLTGSGKFIKAGAGRMDIYGPATFPGDLEVRVGSLFLINDSPITQTYSGTVSGTGTLNKSGTGTTRFSGNVSVTALAASAGTLDFSGTQTVSTAFSGAGNVTKTGAGTTTTLTGGSSNTGAWNVNSGTLAISTTNVAAPSGVITVASSATLTTGASVAKPITVNAGGTANINAGTTGFLTLNGTGVTFGAGAFTSSSTTGHSIGTTAAGATVLTIPTGRTFSASAGAFNFTPASTGAAAVYQTGGTLSSTGGTLIIGSIPSASAYAYYGLTGGSFSTSNTLTTIGHDTTSGTAGAWAVFDVDGGTFSLGTSSSITALGLSSVAQPTSQTMNILSGAHTWTSPFTIGGVEGVRYAVGVNTQQTLTIKTATVNQTAGYTAFASDAPSVLSSINISNGGSLSVFAMAVYRSGKKQITLNNGTFINKGAYTLGTSPAATNANVVLYGTGNKIGGATVATGVLGAPITQATDYGISTITVGGTNTGYIGPPVVVISGGSGSGATARAVVDLVPASPTYQKVTSIEVTCPGSGYAVGDAGSITVTLGGPSVANGGCTALATASVTALAPNTPDGNIEKPSGDTGTLTLTATNTNTGTYTVTAGTLKIGNAAAAGTLGAVVAGVDTSAASIAASATLNFNRTDARTYSGTITGASSSTLSRTGSTAPTALNSYAAKLTGTNTIYQGIVSVAAANVIEAAGTKALGDGTGGITIASAGALHLSGSFTATANKPITASGTGVAATGAIKNVSGNNTLGGTLTLGAALSIGSDTATDTLTFSNSGNTTLSATNTLSFVGAGDIDFSPTLIGTGGTVTKTSGAGAAILRGTNTYTGVTTASAGYLGYATQIVNSTNGSFGNATSNILVAESAGLRYYGTGNVAFSRGIQFTGATAGATYKLESNGTGAVTHSAAPSYAAPAQNLAKTIQFGGTGTASNTVSYIIANNGTGAVTINKADAGKWVFSNTGNSYTGGTNVNTGTLVLSIATWASNASVTNASTGGIVTVANGAKIQTLTGTGANAQLGRHTYKNLTFAAGGRIRIGG